MEIGRMTDKSMLCCDLGAGHRSGGAVKLGSKDPDSVNINATTTMLVLEILPPALTFSISKQNCEDFEPCLFIKVKQP
jgi:hypothetical protein